jgi:uncharacterized Zn finger protein
LKITDGVINAIVIGSSRYKVEVKIDPLDEVKKTEIIRKISGKIDSIQQLVSANFPKELQEVFLNQSTGLFPSPREIHMRCSCPDSAYMCKHIAAVLYGVGNRLDIDPLLFFKLRSIDPDIFISKVVSENINSIIEKATKKSKRAISLDEIKSLFDDIN